MNILADFLPLFAWAVLWATGGWMLSASIFHLRRNETAMVGLAMGLVLQTWLANALSHGLPFLAAIWTSAALTCLAGCVAMLALRKHVRFTFSWPQMVLLGGLVALFALIGRGLGIFDDYQNLPTISLMATGDVPPHFALNPSLSFGYHYFLLLFAAQLMRLGSMFPWTALDVARALIMALPLVLAGTWAYRVTRSQLAAVLTAAVLAFAGGSRWLMLLLPPAWLNAISGNIKLIGSASASAPTYAEALLTNWKIDGAGPIPFPFAFYTGINQPFVMAYTGISGMGILILLVLLLISNRWRHWTAGIVICITASALALANEIAFLLLAFGTLVVTSIWIGRNRSWRIPASLARWEVILLASGVVAAIQGGLLTEMVRGAVGSQSEAASYFDTSLSFVWPPAMVSAHLGSLSLTNPAQLLAGLMEIGPIILATPLVIAWAWKSFRLKKWYETSLIAAAAGAIPAIFIQFKGPLFTAAPRLMSGWFFACGLYVIPLVWNWIPAQRGRIQATVASGVLAACLSGMMLLSIQLLAIQRPVLATFISPLDARISQDYWNKLEPEARIFDPIIYRAPTVFGRFTVSSPSWYTRDPKWLALDAAPDPHSIREAGFEYMYFGKDYWDDLTAGQQSLFSDACVEQVAQVDGIHSEQDYTKDFRRLLDLRQCQ